MLLVDHHHDTHAYDHDSYLMINNFICLAFTQLNKSTLLTNVATNGSIQLSTQHYIQISNLHIQYNLRTSKYLGNFLQKQKNPFLYMDAAMLSSSTENWAQKRLLRNEYMTINLLHIYF